MNYKELSQEAHENAVVHGFWEKDWSNEHCLMLIIGEVSEMVEAHRKGLRANVEDFKEIPNRQLAFEKFIKNTMEDEMADVVIRLCDLAGARDIDFNNEFKIYQLKYYKEFSFVEKSFILTKFLCNIYVPFDFKIKSALRYMEDLAHDLNVDLDFFVTQKMEYNTRRPYRHGKKY